MKPSVLAMLAILPMLASCEPAKPAMSEKTAAIPEVPAGAETATLGAGCYWCIEAAYRQFEGVHSATSGFMGGAVKNPTYARVCEGDTGHAEVVQVVFDPEKISYGKILDWFWELHDPTTLNRQGNDAGTQYRSAIFYHSDEQKKAAEASKAAAAGKFKSPIVTEIVRAREFYPAPADHQDYYFQNKSKNPYCRFVIEPKLKKLKLEH
ncbi:MAG: peptide-methionine (S)-S-oxide reductase MsrA [Luteolibacter sp.]|jgi:peptide-methionine (S)-S-oxide reductase|nr:peptide-methionine (S)-S-oxide reductase MsrA [Luteolibacter sp.]